MHRIVVPLALAALLAGCLGGTLSESETWFLSGGLDESTTQADLDALAADVPEGAELTILESHPMQFQIRGMTKETCPDVRVKVLAHDFVRDVRACEPINASGAAPDVPTSHGSPSRFALDSPG